MDSGEAAQEALQEFYEWIEAMPIAEAELAIKGLEAYFDDLQTERDIALGWHRTVNKYTDTDLG